jgi:cytidine deaminase
MDEAVRKTLLAKAKEMMGFSYSPYSHFRVGAALLGKSGTIYGGCNIENASYTPTVCAERTAFFKAVTSGEKAFEAIAIVGGPDGEIRDFCPPCGVCRQVMAEFCQPDGFRILLENAAGEIKEFTLAELLPLGFGPGNLAK